MKIISGGQTGVDRGALDAAIASYRTRERRFGRTSEQLGEPASQPAPAVSPAARATGRDA